jgi:cobalamin biosynthesis protein CobT
MLKTIIFEKTPLDEYNKKLKDYMIKFQIFSELKEFQKIGRIEVTKEEFYKSLVESEEKIIDKTTSRKLIKELKNIKVYAQCDDAEDADAKDAEDADADTEDADTEDTDADTEDADANTENADTEDADTENANTDAENADAEDEKNYYKYYIFEIGYWQKWSRWWNSENRGKTQKYIDEDFSEFMKYLNEIKTMNDDYSFNIYYKNLLKKCHLFINKITPGLYNLKKTYSDNKKIKALIDSVILTLLDFKNETQIKKHISLSSILREHNNIFLIP